MSDAAFYSIMTTHGKTHLHVAGALIVTIGLIAIAYSTSAAAQNGQLQVMMKDRNGKNVGIVRLEDTPNGVLIHGDLTDLPEGAHGFHIHEVGKCEPPFESAGAHVHDGSTKHGFANSQGWHAGDLPNVNVLSTGKVSIDAFASKVRFKDGTVPLLDADGSALVLHAGPDDYRSDPAGGAGDRIACGVIRSLDNVSTQDIEPR
jgi:Cu-Zn family superoxide dismutase